MPSNGLQGARLASTPRMAYSPLEPDALTMLFPTPLLRVSLNSVLPPETLDNLAESILESWQAHGSEQKLLPETDATRGSDWDDKAVKARSADAMNEEFFYFQRRRFGVTGHASAPKPESWMASEAAQELIEAVTAAASGYLERVAHYSGLTIGRRHETDGEWQIDADDWHVWASVHETGSSHASHVHSGAKLSAVVYVRTPPGSGAICFLDPRGRLPPFERQVRHPPEVGDLLVFPPWLSHAVTSSAVDRDAGPRISVSFNLVEPEGSGGGARWGDATACLEVLTIEDGLGLGGIAEEGEEL